MARNSRNQRRLGTTSAVQQTAHFWKCATVRGPRQTAPRLIEGRGRDVGQGFGHACWPNSSWKRGQSSAPRCPIAFSPLAGRRRGRCRGCRHWPRPSFANGGSEALRRRRRSSSAFVPLTPRPLLPEVAADIPSFSIRRKEEGVATACCATGSDSFVPSLTMSGLKGTLMRAIPKAVPPSCGRLGRCGLWRMAP